MITTARRDSSLVCVVDPWIDEGGDSASTGFLMTLSF